MDSNLFDVVIIGGGPAGLAAALYIARARYRVLVVEKERIGGQITITSEVVNYPGVAKGSGEEITSVMRSQAQNFGAEFLLAEVTGVDLEGDVKVIHTSRGEFKAFGVIMATGAHPRSIGFQGEEEFKGRGVAYCATCDGEFFTGLDVFVVGGGFAAAEESIFLTKYAKHVTVLVRGDDFSCAKATADEVKKNENITIHYNTEIESLSGDGELKLLKGRNRKTGDLWEYEPEEGKTFGVFVFAGYEPETSLIKGQVNLDEKGYVVTDENGKTNVEGVYAAGDLRQKVLRQMVTATADGAIAGTELERYVVEMQKKTGIVPEVPATRISSKDTSSKTEDLSSDFFTEDVIAQLKDVFDKMAEPLVLKAELDEQPISQEVDSFVRELASLTDKITVKYQKESFGEALTPSIRVLRQDNEDTGVAFHGVPGGHEFNSFVISLYNAAGPGQALDEQILEKIRNIKKPIDMKILVSLSCTMCPELVMAAQRMAVENPLIRGEAYDLNHFPQLRDEFKVMSVPCLVVNDTVISFGKKNIPQLLEFLEEEKMI